MGPSAESRWAHGIEWRLFDQLTRWGLSPPLLSCGGVPATDSLKGQTPPKLQTTSWSNHKARGAPDILTLSLRAKHRLVTTWSANVDANCAQTEWGRCTCADLEVGGAVEEGEPSEPIAAVPLRGWPPFTGCWLACYIKETPPTAAPDKLDTSERGRQSQEIFASPDKTDTQPPPPSSPTPPCWSRAEFTAFIVLWSRHGKWTLLSADCVFCCLPSEPFFVFLPGCARLTIPPSSFSSPTTTANRKGRILPNGIKYIGVSFAKESERLLICVHHSSKSSFHFVQW